MKRLGSIWGAAFVLAAAACMLLAPHVARAQDESVPELSRDWAVRLGPYVYNSKTTRAQNGDVGISGLVERRVIRGNSFDLMVGIGYNGYDRVYSVPVTISAIAHRGKLRAGFGLGYAFNKRLSGEASNGTVKSLILGYQITSGKNALSADMRYFFVGGSSDELSGYSLTLGYQF